MNNYDYKYRNNKLSVKELVEYKELLNSVDDTEIEKCLEHTWFNEDIDISMVGDAATEKIKKNIDVSITDNKKRKYSLSFMGKVAAAVLLPVFILTNIYLYRENNQLTSEELIVFTGNNERANITLPDGTCVTLNSASEIRYKPKVFNKKERNIHFEGEGYFQVHSDKERPFVIDAKGMRVKVLGTKFNLMVREENNTAELALEEGGVSLTSLKNNEEVMLKPNQKAVLNHADGMITAFNDDFIKDASAWERGDMVFRNTVLVKVIKSVEENYNVKIKIDCQDCLSDSFTGTIPLNDLYEVLEIIERSYHLSTTIKGKEIIMTPL